MRQFTEKYSLRYVDGVLHCEANLDKEDVRNIQRLAKEDFDGSDFLIDADGAKISCSASGYDSALDYARNILIGRQAKVFKDLGRYSAYDYWLVVTSHGVVVHKEKVYIRVWSKI